MKNQFGYIVLTKDTGKKIPINIRSILRYDFYTNPYTKPTRTRLWYLDNKYVNIQEEVEEIDEMINTIIGLQGNEKQII